MAPRSGNARGPRIVGLRDMGRGSVRVQPRNLAGLLQHAANAGAAALGARLGRAPGVGGGNGTGTVVTTQNDFKYSRSMTRSKTGKKKYRKMRSLVNKRMKKFKIKVRTAMKKPKYICKFISNIGRSFLSGTNASAVVLIPIYAFRGGNGSSTSDAIGAATPGGSSYTFRGDMLSQIKNYYATTRWFPSGAAANTQHVPYWFKHKWSALDMTLANSGGSAEGPSLTTNRAVPLEYEIYKIWPGRKAPIDPSVTMDSLAQVFTYAGGFQQIYGSASAGTYPDYSFGDPGYTPWKQCFSNKIIKGKKIGEGYIGVGGAARFKFMAKRGKRGYYSKFITDKLDAGADSTTLAIYPGHSMFIAVVFRGVPNGVSTTTSPTMHPQARMSFLLNWQHFTQASGDSQPGADTRYLAADSYA